MIFTVTRNKLLFITFSFFISRKWVGKGFHTKVKLNALHYVIEYSLSIKYTLCVLLTVYILYTVEIKVI